MLELPSLRKNPDNIRIGAALKAVRQATRLRQVDVATAISVAPKTYEQWEQGYVSIKASYIPLLASALGRSPEALMAALSTPQADPGAVPQVSSTEHVVQPVTALAGSRGERTRAAGMTRGDHLSRMLQYILEDYALSATRLNEIASFEPGTIERIISKQIRLPTPPMLFRLATALENDEEDTTEERQIRAFLLFTRLMDRAGYWVRSGSGRTGEYHRIVGTAISEGLKLVSDVDIRRNKYEIMENEYVQRIDALSEITHNDLYLIQDLTKDEQAQAGEFQSRIDEIKHEIAIARHELEEALERLREFFSTRLHLVIHGELELPDFAKVDGPPK